MKAKSSAEKDEYKAALCWHISSCIFGFSIGPQDP